MNKIKAVIFDMDGVLIDAKEWHYEALNRALRLFGIEIKRQDHLAVYDGLSTSKKLEILSSKTNLPIGLHTLITNLKQKYTMDTVFSRCIPVPQHIDALEKLKNEGYRLAVCSNSVRQSVKIMMELSGLLKYLEFYLSNQDVVKSKPNPEMYNKAIARLQLQPNECLVLEDNENGIKAALASGSHLLRINTVDDVSYSNIRKRIDEIENT